MDNFGGKTHVKFWRETRVKFWREDAESVAERLHNHEIDAPPELNVLTQQLKLEAIPSVSNRITPSTGSSPVQQYVLSHNTCCL